MDYSVSRNPQRQEDFLDKTQVLEPEVFLEIKLKTCKEVFNRRRMHLICSLQIKLLIQHHN